MQSLYIKILIISLTLASTAAFGIRGDSFDHLPDLNQAEILLRLTRALRDHFDGAPHEAGARPMVDEGASNHDRLPPPIDLLPMASLGRRPDREWEDANNNLGEPAARRSRLNQTLFPSEDNLPLSPIDDLAMANLAQELDMEFQQDANNNPEEPAEADYLLDGLEFNDEENLEEEEESLFVPIARPELAVLLLPDDNRPLSPINPLLMAPGSLRVNHGPRLVRNPEINQVLFPEDEFNPKWGG